MTIEAKNLLKIYGKRKVVNDVDVNVQRGEVVGLLGPNGAGKTTTFYMVVGLIKPNKGSIFLDGKNISKAPMYKRSRLGLGYLPQEASVFRKLTVEQNIKAIWELRGGAPTLSIIEKLDMILRKSERSWWKRSKYETYYSRFLNDLISFPEEQSDFIKVKSIDVSEAPKNVNDKIFFISQIMKNLDLNIDDHIEKVSTFLTDYSKFYLLGKKKKLEEFLGIIWKIKRDEIYEKFKSYLDKDKKIEIIKLIIKYLDIDEPSVYNELNNLPDINDSNSFIDYIQHLESVYWKQRKNILNINQEELKRLELLKKDKLNEELNKFLKDNNFKPTEINDIFEIINFNAKQSQHYQLEDVLDEFNISHIRNSKGSDLSGGERRRVEIARAVANKPSFLLLDEPFAGIDPIAVSGIKDMIVLLKSRNIGVLITDHNVRETLKIIDRGYILSDGKVIEQGTREHLANSEIARKHYLGEDFAL
jgi:ABC-type lipopolysaccharide export system ATPase subunit